MSHVAGMPLTIPVVGWVIPVGAELPFWDSVPKAQEACPMSKTRFSLEGRKGAQVKSITIRETDGHDEEIAAKVAKSRGEGANDVEELVRLSIVEVDDKPVKQPLVSFDDWNSKTRGYALWAWKAVNAIPKEEEAGFVAGGEEVA